MIHPKENKREKERETSKFNLPKLLFKRERKRKRKKKVIRKKGGWKRKKNHLDNPKNQYIFLYQEHKQEQTKPFYHTKVEMIQEEMPQPKTVFTKVKKKKNQKQNKK